MFLSEGALNPAADPSFVQEKHTAAPASAAGAQTVVATLDTDRRLAIVSRTCLRRERQRGNGYRIADALGRCRTVRKPLPRAG